MTDQQPSPGPLEGVRVLDLTDAMGVYCTKLLADLGADVLKIEPPGGAPGRSRGPFVDDVPHPERSLWWFYFNTNKRSITLNLDTADGRALFRRLAEQAAVVVEDSIPGTMTCLGLGYEDLRALNPGLVYTSITAFGQEGPRATYKASDLIGQAMGGLMYRIGWPEDPPNSLGGSQAYNQAGAHGAIGTLLALRYRDLTGRGQHVDVSMEEAVSIINYDAAPRWALQQSVIRRMGPGQGSSGAIATRIWPCAGGGQVRFQLVGNQAVAEWPRLVAWMAESGMAEDLGDEKYADPFDRQKLLPEIEPVVGRFLLTKTARQAQEEGQARRIMVMAFNTVADLFTDPQLTEEGFFVDLDHPDLGRSITYPGAPYRLSTTPWALRHPAPHLGQHNLEVYEAELGLTRQEVVRLKQAGVI